MASICLAYITVHCFKLVLENRRQRRWEAEVFSKMPPDGSIYDLFEQRGFLLGINPQQFAAHDAKKPAA